MNRIEIEERLVNFYISIIGLCKDCVFDEYTQHLAKQIVRSSSSAALNYGEAQSAESRADFGHKLSLVLKELRESHINLTIVNKAGICRDPAHAMKVLNESRELVAIFQKTVNSVRNGK